MTDTNEPLSPEEIERAHAEPLPDREVMSLIDPTNHLGPPVPGDLGPDPVTTLPLDPAAE
jgi:hypothetical protein